MFNLSGKVALVTGASRGIGKGTALCLASAGADVAVNYHEHKEQADEVVEAILEMGRKAVAYKADVSDQLDVRLMFERVKKDFGRLDILINNAGTSRDQNIFETDLESFKRLMDINLTSTFLCSKEAMQIMKEQGFGRIIQVSSVVGHQGALKGHVHYASSKSAQLGFTKTLARTGALYGITVNAIAPGIISTELLYKTHGEEGVAKLGDKVPLGLGTVDDVGMAVVYLSSDEARYVTGSTIDVNGGLYMR